MIRSSRNSVWSPAGSSAARASSSAGSAGTTNRAPRWPSTPRGRPWSRAESARPTWACCSSRPAHPITRCLPPPPQSRALGATSAGAVDLAGACAGFVYALSLADSWVRSHQAPVLVVAANVLSRRLDPTDPGVRAVFADGGGAVVIGPGTDDMGLRSFAWGADASPPEPSGWRPAGPFARWMPAPTLTAPSSCVFTTAGAVFTSAVDGMVRVSNLLSIWLVYGCYRHRSMGSPPGQRQDPRSGWEPNCISTRSICVDPARNGATVRRRASRPRCRSPTTQVSLEAGRSILLERGRRGHGRSRRGGRLDEGRRGEHDPIRNGFRWRSRRASQAWDREHVWHPFTPMTPYMESTRR